MRTDQELLSAEISESRTTEGKYLTFWTANQLFAIAIDHVEQIVGLQEITQVPDSPAYSRGIINLRGSIIPVIDMRLRLGKPETAYNDRTCIIITKPQEEFFGFIVDEVDEVADIAQEQISPPPQMGAEAENRYLIGVARKTAGDGKPEKIVLLLDIGKILTEHEMAALSRAAR